jgi:hypothetical protein
MSDSIRLIAAGNEFMFAGERELSIGRAVDADIRLDSMYVSRHHGRLVATPDGWLYEDVGSRRGTYFRGRRVTKLLLVGPVTLLLGEPGHGAEIRILPQHPSRIFICYRREDSAGHAGRLRDRLVLTFGKTQVFRDIDNLQIGEDFVERITRTIATCRVVLVVIGRHWLDARDADGRRRLDDPEDYVRLEVMAALNASSPITIIPVLVQGAAMPRTDDLPVQLRPLCRRSALVASDERWTVEMDELVDQVETIMRTSTEAP